MDVADAAVDRLTAGGQICEKVAVILLDVGVMVPARLEHERYVAVEPLLGVVATIAAYHLEEFGREPVVECVFAGREELVVVDAVLSPERGLLAEDVKLWARRCPLAPPKDAARMRIAWGEIERAAGRRYFCELWNRRCFCELWNRRCFCELWDRRCFCELWIVAIKHHLVVVPVDGHRHCIGDERAEKGSLVCRHGHLSGGKGKTSVSAA